MLKVELEGCDLDNIEIDDISEIVLKLEMKKGYSTIAEPQLNFEMSD